MKWERRFVERHPGHILRGDDTLHVRMFTGEWRRVQRKCGECLNVLELQSGDRFYVIREQWFEGNTWLLFDRATGRVFDVGGYPLFSPDGRRFIAASEDLDAGYSPTVFDLYDVTEQGARLAFRHRSPRQPEAPGLWAARGVCWTGDDSVAYRRTHVSPSDEQTYIERPRTLSLRDGKWRIELPAPDAPSCVG